jgi:hypothetical protein
MPKGATSSEIILFSVQLELIARRKLPLHRFLMVSTTLSEPPPAHDLILVGLPDCERGVSCIL